MIFALAGMFVGCVYLTVGWILYRWKSVGLHFNVHVFIATPVHEESNGTDYIHQ